MLSIGVIAAIASMLIATASGIISKRVVKNLSVRASALTTVGIGAVPIALGLLIAGTYSLPLNDIIICLASGIFLSAGFIFRYMSLKSQQLTTTTAFGEVQQAIIVIFGLLVFSEYVSWIGLASIAVIFIGSGLLITVEGFRLNRKLIPAFLANVSWAAYWIIITFSVTNSGNFLFSLFLSRAAGIVVLVALMPGTFARKSGSSLRIDGKDALSIIALLAIVTGLANGLGDALFGVVAYYNIVAIGGAINALTPIIVGAVAYFLYRDRLNKAQLVGFIIMIAGAVVLSLM